MKKPNRINAIGSLFSVSSDQTVSIGMAEKISLDLDEAIKRLVTAQQTEDDKSILVRYGMLLTSGVLLRAYFMEAIDLIKSGEFNISDMSEFRDNTRSSNQFTSSIFDILPRGSL